MINLVVDILTALIAMEHIYILWMEMFAWETAGRRTFGKSLPGDLFKPTKKWQPIRACTTDFWQQV